MVTSNYRGSSRFRVWEAVRASSAAPGFFDDFHAKGQVFEDGALIANNPSLIGYHEASHLWPKEKLQCIVSIEETSTDFYFPSKIIHRFLHSLQDNPQISMYFCRLALAMVDTNHYLSIRMKYQRKMMAIISV